MRNILVLLTILIAGCSTIETDPTRNTATLSWTAVGDDDLIGRAMAYSLRWSLDSVRLITDWGNCNQVNGLPVPKASGQSETFTVINLPSDTVIFFAIKAGDEVFNWSLLSNIVRKRTLDEIPPKAIVIDHIE